MLKSWLNYYTHIYVYSLNNEGISKQRQTLCKGLRLLESFAKGGLRISKKRERVVFKLVPKKTTEVINCQINRLSTTTTFYYYTYNKWNVTCLQINRN